MGKGINGHTKAITLILCVVIGFFVILAFIDSCKEAKAGEDWDDIAFDIAAFAGEWVPTIRYIQIKDTADAVVDTVVSIGGSSVTRDSIYTFLYEAGGVTTGVAVDSFLVQVLDGEDNPADTIWVLEDYDDVYDSNYTPISYLVQVLDSLNNPTDTIWVIDESLHVWVANYFTAPYWVNVKDSLNTTLYSYYASKDSADVFAVNHWETHYTIQILDSIEALVYSVSALEDSNNTYLRNYYGQGVVTPTVGAPGTSDLCKVYGTLTTPEGNIFANSVVSFRLTSDGPLLWGDAPITKRLYSAKTNAQGRFSISLLPIPILSDTTARYWFYAHDLRWDRQEAYIPDGYDSISIQSIWTVP